MTNSKLIFDLIENGEENITKSYLDFHDFTEG